MQSKNESTRGIFYKNLLSFFRSRDPDIKFFFVILFNEFNGFKSAEMWKEEGEVIAYSVLRKKLS